MSPSSLFAPEKISDSVDKRAEAIASMAYRPTMSVRGQSGSIRTPDQIDADLDSRLNAASKRQRL
jgi:hypothetical protein